MKSLQTIVAEATRIEEMLIESEGVLTPEIEAALVVTEVELPQKIDQYNFVVSRFEALEDYYKTKAQFFNQIQKQCAAVQDRIKSNLKSAMQEMGVDELRGVDFRYKLSKTKPTVVVENEAAIPAAYKKEVISISVDKKMLADDLSMGPIAGAKLEQGYSLRAYANTPKKELK